MQTIPALVRTASATHAHRVFLEDGDTSITYAELPDWVARAADGLRTLGIGHGDRVAIWAPNCWEWVIAALGIHEVGAILVPINTRYKGAEARFIIDKARCKAIFTVDGFLGLDFLQMLDLPELPHIVFKTDSWEAFLDGGIAGESPPCAEDISDILFTSGTTGLPKGVMTTHEQSLRAYTSWAEVVGLSAGDRYLVVAPFFHCFGYKAGWLACLLTGATVLPQPVFDAGACLERIPRDKVSVLPGPPALYQSILLKGVAGHDLSSLRLAVTGAASIPVQLIHDMRDILGFDTVITGYGLTEATGIATMCRFDDDPQTIATTSGRAIPDVQVKLVDTDGNTVGPGEPGHVLVKGYNVMKGYLDEPEATAGTIVDGWLSTGDIGVMNERGYLAITDRLKDMFICGGFNAYPAEIEHCLLGHPDVAEVAVIGVPHGRLGEVGAAYVVPRHGDIDGEALIAWARERLANFKVPRSVHTLDALPRNASAKVMKFELRKQYDAQT